MTYIPPVDPCQDIDLVMVDDSLRLIGAIVIIVISSQLVQGVSIGAYWWNDQCLLADVALQVQRQAFPIDSAN